MASPEIRFSQLVQLFRIDRFHLADGARQVGTSLIELVKRRDLIVTRAAQRVLRLDNFNIVGNSGGETISRLHNFFLRKLNAQIRNFHLMPRGI
jgi:hypothetical protein